MWGVPALTRPPGVTRVTVHEGDAVKAGDVLAEIEAEDLRADVASESEAGV